MKKLINHFTFLLLICSLTSRLSAQEISNIAWPKELTMDNGTVVTIYQPQPESLDGNQLSVRAAVSLKRSVNDEPIFGAIWASAILQTDKDDRLATLESLTIMDAKFPSLTDSNQLVMLRAALEDQVPQWNIQIALDRLVASLEQQTTQSASGLNNNPPDIIYTTTPSVLVVLDGDPIVQMDNDLKMQRVSNTPFLIVQNPDDSRYYLYAGKFWYSSNNILNNWVPVDVLPAKIQALHAQVSQQDNTGDGSSGATPADAAPGNPPAIIVKTSPAELIQTAGEPQFKSIEGTSLLYLSNTSNDIFKDIVSQDNYVLLSGRWYKSQSLNGPWTYVSADQLPSDYARIPRGSDKDEVLASVAGTDESREAVLDASIPQTAKVDRSTATTQVQYDGEPSFQPIDGTDISYATNTSGTVLSENANYYAVDNGIWYQSATPNGPWVVCDQRPAQVDLIPPSCPVYNTRYVYIYETTPDFVYVGYTPGYLNCYIYGPTVVYGTGWYYRPWHRRYFYPRPLTWGFGMYYNPWRGFSMSLGFSVGFFNISFGGRPWNSWHGGWFGPPAYRPPYRPPYYAGGRPGGGYYGPNPSRPNATRPVAYNNNGAGISRNNLYNNQRGVITRDVNRGRGANFVLPQNAGNNIRPVPANDAAQRFPAQTQGNGNNGMPDNDRQNGSNRLPGQPATPAREARSSTQPNNVFADRSGNVYQRDNNGNWNQRDNTTNTWKPAPAQAPAVNNLDRQNQMRDRGNMRVNNFNQSRPAPAPAPRAAPSGGGGRPSGNNNNRGR